MPVSLTVSAVRDALYLAAGGPGSGGTGSPSTALLGSWFHEGLTWLVGNESCDSPLARLADAGPDLEVWKQTLADELYTRFVGPRLSRERAKLHSIAPRVLTFWHAMRSASDWLAELGWAIRQKSPRQRGEPAVPWRTLSNALSLEEELVCELREPGWTDSVRLVGIADAIVRLEETGAWCAIELKLGQTAPEADLGQACLYHLLITSTTAQAAGSDATNAGSAPPVGALAVVSFQPGMSERLFDASQLGAAKDRLVALIGQLAGVAPTVAEDNATGGTIERPEAGSSESLSGESSYVGAVLPQHLDMGAQLIATLAEYCVNVQLDGPPIVGPTFLRFPIVLGRGMKVRSVEKHAAELQMRLQLASEPFIQRDAGRLVIDVQRPDRQTVYFREIRSQLPTPRSEQGGSVVPIGVDLMGKLVCADLARPDHAHILAAGTTGSGKSEWLRLALAGLMVTNTPATLRLLVIDPKRNAFYTLQGSPFLWRPLVFPDEQSTAAVLAQLVEEMEARYRKFDGDDSIAAYAARTGEVIPRIVCVCDEYRDLICRDRVERKAIEGHICRLGAKARAAGIQLILATQEPSRDTIKGTLDSNIPARVGLKMQKRLESNMLLNEAGAEKLLNHGDLLFKDVGAPRRLQAPLLTEADRVEIFSPERR